MVIISFLYLQLDIFRILIETGILIHGFYSVTRNDGDEGPPPLTTNFLAAINTLTSENADNFDLVSLGTILHASSALLNRETLERNEYEEFIKKFSILFQKLMKQKTKNSPLYSQIVQALWISEPIMV